MPIRPTRILSAVTLSFAALLLVPSAKSQSPDSLSTRIDLITSRPVFRRANFGIEIYSLEQNKILFSQNPDKLFVPASTTKLLTEGTLLAKLGADYRFHTRVYKTGTIDKKGQLKGDLILVASGDPNLSNRLQTDDTLAFRDEDHSYQGPAVSGDPLTAIKEIAKQVAAKGIRKITGHIYIDSSLFPEGDREGGTGVVMSAIIVNDNVIDLLGKPGKKVGDPIEVQTSPRTSYISFVNHSLTLPATSKPTLETPSVETNPDGTVKVVLSGGIPVSAEPQTGAFSVPAPSQFAQTVLREALQNEGIAVREKNFVAYDGGANRSYTTENLVAEHISAPLSEEIKVTLKVSQNLHASMGIQYLGAFTAKNSSDALQDGFKAEQAFLTSAGLDLSGASQGDGAGGDWADLFSPDFMVHYLTYWTTRPDYQIFLHALPILGKDGTLAKIQVNSPAAGHVFAKTGTFNSEDRLNGVQMLNAKGLAGYITTKKGEHLVFAAYVNHASLPADPDSAQQIAGQALGEIAAAAYDSN
jgi:D-alanyl-D-alanine carboxypeptidase/D-alanyl-D-alanine-endopeptidase (penicillin-binding protein 4)